MTDLHGCPANIKQRRKGNVVDESDCLGVLEPYAELAREKNKPETDADGHEPEIIPLKD